MNRRKILKAAAIGAILASTATCSKDSDKFMARFYILLFWVK